MAACLERIRQVPLDVGSLQRSDLAGSEIYCSRRLSRLRAMSSSLLAGSSTAMPSGHSKLRTLRSSATGLRCSRQRTVVTRSGQKPADRGLGLLEWTSKILPQGKLVKGVKLGWKLAWQTMVKELAPQSKEGEYVRPTYAFGGRIGEAAFPAEAGRYHVYVGNGCPWCQRVLLVLAVRGLSGAVSWSRVLDDPEEATRGGWVFTSKTPDPIFGAKDIWEVYDRLSPGYRGRCTAPLLVDRLSRRIVSNESADIVRMLNDLQLPGASDVDLYPMELRPKIDEWNERIYSAVNNGVYRSGFSTSQAAYDGVQRQLYQCLDEIEAQLATTRFLLGDRFTEADLRLFPTIIRFDAVYSTLFKCPRRVAEYPNLSAWMRDVHQLKVSGSQLQIADTIDIDDARRSYFSQLFPLNPGGIVPTRPTAADLLLGVPAGRGPTDVSACFHMRARMPQPSAV